MTTILIVFVSKKKPGDGAGALCPGGGCKSAALILTSLQTGMMKEKQVCWQKQRLLRGQPYLGHPLRYSIAEGRILYPHALIAIVRLASSIKTHVQYSKTGSLHLWQTCSTHLHAHKQCWIGECRALGFVMLVSACCVDAPVSAFKNTMLWMNALQTHLSTFARHLAICACLTWALVQATE